MEATGSHRFRAAVTLICLLTAVQQQAPAQATDSSASQRQAGGALQFQLIGGLGVYYIGAWGNTSYFRVGGDVSLNHTTSSGTTEENSLSSGNPPSSASGPTDQTAFSYQISASALWLRTIAEYGHGSLYCGAGPLATYSHDRSNSSSTNNYNNQIGNYSYAYSNEGTTDIFGVGPLALVGVRARVFEPVCLTAEMGVSAVYQWTTRDQSSTSSGGPQNPYLNTDRVNTTLGGWSVQIRSIQIGVIVEL